MGDLKSRAVLESRDVGVLDQRARLAAELGARALDPAESFLSGPAGALACELYRESIYWSLCSQRARRGELSTQPDPSSAGALGALWAELERAVPQPSDADLTEARVDFVERTFVDFAELGPAAQEESARRLARVAGSLLAASSTTRQEIDAVWFKRTLRLGAIALVAVAALVGLSMLGTWREASKDFAQGRPWRASSTYGVVGCRSPAQTCAESPSYFMHTQQEEGPWVEFDLGVPELVASVRIDNRKDCCAERAAPLVVELSTDKHRYTEVARRTDTFSTWKPEFEARPARYVRVRAVGRTILHLSRVKVLPP